LPKIVAPTPSRREFETVYGFLTRRLEPNDVFQILEQEELPATTVAALARLDERLFEITEAGGEGLILRKPNSLWVPERSHQVLKVKKLDDAEGIVTGFTWGRETDKGSKLLGKMGALILDFNGKKLELSGFTDAEREMALECQTTAPDGMPWREHYAAAIEIGRLHPGEIVQAGIFNPKFPRGSRVSFRYRELSDSGIPKEARYWRKS
jgi:ATP-dependent DNA ligase